MKFIIISKKDQSWMDFQSTLLSVLNENESCTSQDLDRRSSPSIKREERSSSRSDKLEGNAEDDD